MKKNYQVTIGYRAVISIHVKAEDEKTAKEQALKIMKQKRDKMFDQKTIFLQDDRYGADGILNMDETWDML